MYQHIEQRVDVQLRTAGGHGSKSNLKTDAHGKRATSPAADRQTSTRNAKTDGHGQRATSSAAGRQTSTSDGQMKYKRANRVGSIRAYHGTISSFEHAYHAHSVEPIHVHSLYSSIL